MKKTEGRKSRWTVPLKIYILLYSDIFISNIMPGLLIDFLGELYSSIILYSSNKPNFYDLAIFVATVASDGPFHAVNVCLLTSLAC